MLLIIIYNIQYTWTNNVCACTCVDILSILHPCFNVSMIARTEL